MGRAGRKSSACRWPRSPWAKDRVGQAPVPRSPAPSRGRESGTAKEGTGLDKCLERTPPRLGL